MKHRARRRAPCAMMWGRKRELAMGGVRSEPQEAGGRIFRNLCVFSWFLKVMLLSMVFGCFFLGFPMDFHREGS